MIRGSRCASTPGYGLAPRFGVRGDSGGRSPEVAPLSPWRPPATIRQPCLVACPVAAAVLRQPLPRVPGLPQDNGARGRVPLPAGEMVRAAGNAPACSCAQGRRLTFRLRSEETGVPCGSCTRLRGFADRGLGGSANGTDRRGDAQRAGGCPPARVVAFLASLNRRAGLEPVPSAQSPRSAKPAADRNWGDQPDLHRYKRRHRA